ncbi:MAG TPA: hypothetical protein VK780_02410, partial [Thermoanaerobaculia bacterium]|nr:hypothetical protein [Thermoanaerobaculia bacterium]
MKNRRKSRIARLGAALLFCAGAAAGYLAQGSLQAAGSLDGYWLSDGYGYQAEIHGGEIKLFEVTPVSCLPSDTFDLKAEPADPRGARFVSRKGRGMFFLSAGPSADAEWFQAPDAASRILFRRATRSELCARTTVNDPMTNFEI